MKNRLSRIVQVDEKHNRYGIWGESYNKQKTVKRYSHPQKRLNMAKLRKISMLMNMVRKVSMLMNVEKLRKCRSKKDIGNKFM